MKSYSNKYASIEQNSDGTWTIFNDVQGLSLKTVPTYKEARTSMIEINQHYSSIARKAGW